MGIVNRIETAENLYSLSQGQIPVSFALRLVPIFFFRKKGLTKAQRKKMMMRKRRMFVDRIVMHHKRLHDQNREKIIEETKEKLSKKPSQILSKPNSSPKLSRLKPHPDKNDFKWQQKVKPKQGEHRTKVKGLVDPTRERSRSKWTVRVAKDNNTREI